MPHLLESGPDTLPTFFFLHSKGHEECQELRQTQKLILAFKCAGIVLYFAEAMLLHVIRLSAFLTKN